VGAAIGMAVGGLKPVVEIQFSGFTYSAFNQLANDTARLRNRSRGSLTVPMVLRTPHGGGIRAPEHHSECMEALFAHMRGLKVVIPSTPYDTKGLLIAAIRDPDPVVFLEPARIYRSVRQEVPEKAYTIQIGKARVEVEGNELTLVSYGAQMKEAREAVQLLAGRGHAVELIDLRTIYPLDAEALAGSVRKTGRLLVVHEAQESFGAAAEVMAAAVEGAFESLQAPPARLTGPDTFIPLARGEHHYLIRSEHIVAEGKVLELKVQPGQRVKQGQTLAVVETDKVVADIPSPRDGTLLSFGAAEGEIIQVGRTLATIEIEDSEREQKSPPRAGARFTTGGRSGRRVG
jgi:pyruvate dehydrogenase E1 component beta subunit